MTDKLGTRFGSISVFLVSNGLQRQPRQEEVKAGHRVEQSHVYICTALSQDHVRTCANSCLSAFFSAGPFLRPVNWGWPQNLKA
jgi:hypothetical protein